MGSSLFARRYWGNNYYSLFLSVLRCFTSRGLRPRRKVGVNLLKQIEFPHSEIFGSKVARHLPEAYRRHATSFIAFKKPRHPPYALKIPIRNSKNHFYFLTPTLLICILRPEVCRLVTSNPTRIRRTVIIYLNKEIHDDFIFLLPDNCWKKKKYCITTCFLPKQIVILI